MDEDDDQDDNPLLPNHSNIVEQLLDSCVCWHRSGNESHVKQAHDEISNAETLQHAEDSDVLEGCAISRVQKQAENEQSDWSLEIDDNVRTT